MSNNQNDSSGREPEISNLTPAELELERALATLRPASTKLDASAAMFDAGRAVGAAAERRSASRTAIGWRAAAALLTVTTGVSLIANVRQMSTDRPIAHIPTIGTPTTGVTPAVAPDTTPSRDDTDNPNSRTSPNIVRTGVDLLALRTIALAEGVDALPRSSFGSLSAPMRVGDTAPRQ